MYKYEENLSLKLKYEILNEQNVVIWWYKSSAFRAFETGNRNHNYQN